MAERVPDDKLLSAACEAAFAEILRQQPGAVDCSKNRDLSSVLAFDGIDLRAVVAAALLAACGLRTKP